MSTTLTFADPRELDYFAPQDGLGWSNANGQDGLPGCVSITGDTEDPVGALPTYRFAEFDDSVNAGSNSIEFYINVRDTQTTGDTRLFFYQDSELADGVTYSLAALTLLVNRGLASSTFRLQARNASGSYPFASDAINRNEWHKVTLDFTHTGALCTVDISINDSLYLSGHVCEFTPIGKLAIESTATTNDVLIDDITTDSTARDKEPYSDIDVTKDTPYGRYYDGEDITLPLQWACTNAHTLQRHVKIPPGRFEISAKVTTPFRSGGKLLGSGTIDPTISSDKKGTGTVLVYTGTDDGHAMIKVTGSNWEVGGWTMYATGYSSAVGLAFGKPTGATGLGTGKSEIQPLKFEGFDRCVQLRISTEDVAENVDNLIFARIEAENCTTVVHMNSTQVMDIVIRKLHMGNCTYGIYCQGGGQLHVEHALFTYGTQTMLYIPADADVGNNNGKFIFDSVKVDNQMGNNFTAVNDLCDDTHQIHIRGLLCSPSDFDGNFASITGRTFLTIELTEGSLKRITGTTGSGANAVDPTVLLIANHLEQPVEDIFTGNINYRAVHNVDWGVDWRDDIPQRVSFQSQIYNSTTLAAGTRQWQ